jgi:hypothetical protein
MRRWTIAGLAALGGLTIIASGAVHLYLWGRADGYRAVKTIGPLFLVQGIVGCLLGLTMLVRHRRLVTAAGVAYMASSIGGLLSSVRWGLFGYNETMDAPWAWFSLGDELVGLVALLALGAVLFTVHGGNSPSTGQ